MRPNPSTALAEVIVDELVRNGVEFFVISPGSRSAALAIAAAGHPGADTTLVIDERSAAFLALGRAKAGRAAAVIATSGTAIANWFPAVVEADMSLTPLILLSADRPEELRGVGANQTIDQVGLFGAKVRHSADIQAVDGSDQNAAWREAVCRAVAASNGVGGKPGPVQMNVAFREPTVPVADDGRTAAEPFFHATSGTPGTGPWLQAGPEPIRRVAESIPGAARGLVIAGDGRYDRPSLLAEANRLGWPVLATVMSGLRGNPVVDSYHHILSGPVSADLTPEVVVAVGAIGPSDRLEALIATAPERIRIDFWGRRIDPARNATRAIAADPVAVLAQVPSRPHEEWAMRWASSQEVVRGALVEEIAGTWGTGSAVIAATAETSLSCLVAASSLPIREVDAHWTRSVPVIANRGASGIDGIVSVALGVATAIPGTVLVTGDLSLYHDSNGFLSEEVGGLVTVVLDNGGGGLFDSLPTAAHAPSYERLFVTPPNRRVADMAAFHHLDHHRAESAEDLLEVVEEALAAGRRALVEVPVDRMVDLEMRRRLDRVARSALQA